jgi:hypothetical protein
MDRKELQRHLKSLNSAELDTVTVYAGLDAGYLPPSGAPPAARGSAILSMAEQPGGIGLAALEAAFIELRGGKVHAVAAHRCILILAANPVDTNHLRLGDEVGVIQDAMRDGEGSSYSIKTEWAVSSGDLQRCLQKHKPSIVHFSGHGSPTGEIVLQGKNGKAEVVPARALVGLFEILQGTETVVLNACYSAEQAEALAKVVAQVIGMSRKMGDGAALQFAAGFYGGLAFVKDYRRAFQLGCNRIDLAGLPDSAVPRFKTRDTETIAVR